MGTIISGDSNSGKTYIPFFDLDRTIININSANTLIHHAYKHGLMTKMDLIKGICFSLLYMFDLKDTTKIINSMIKWVKGVSESTINELSDEMFKNSILKSIRREVHSEINFHKENGGRVVILSSAILPVCRIVADHLGMDDIICSNLEILNGVYTGKSSRKLCFGEEKVARLIDYCTKQSVEPQYSWYYGDSIADFPVLCAVGNPVCVNPDKKLRKAAFKRGWKTVDWH